MQSLFDRSNCLHFFSPNIIPQYIINLIDQLSFSTDQLYVLSFSAVISSKKREFILFFLTLSHIFFWHVLVLIFLHFFFTVWYFWLLEKYCFASNIFLCVHPFTTTRVWEYRSRQKIRHCNLIQDNASYSSSIFY